MTKAEKLRLARRRSTATKLAIKLGNIGHRLVLAATGELNLRPGQLRAIRLVLNRYLPDATQEPITEQPRKKSKEELLREVNLMAMEDPKVVSFLYETLEKERTKETKS